MFTTMMVAAPITMVIGVDPCAARGRRVVGRAAPSSIPVAVIVLGLVIVRMVPAFQVMQTRIDRINTVLREQITGIRVVRAFVREQQESTRFADANAGLTNVSLRAGRLMSSLFPTVGLIVNLSSIAVLWVGADRVADGEPAGRIAGRLPVVPHSRS